MKSQKQAVVLMVVLILLIVSTGKTVVPLQMNFQGRIADNSGNPISGTVDLTFSIYESEVAPTPIWIETRTGLSVQDGQVDLILGELNPINVWSPVENWLGVKVNTDPEISPRSRLVAVPYAIEAVKLSGDIETNPGEASIKDPISGIEVLKLKSENDEGKIDLIDISSFATFVKAGSYVRVKDGTFDTVYVNDSNQVRLIQVVPPAVVHLLEETPQFLAIATLSDGSTTKIDASSITFTDNPSGDTLVRLSSDGLDLGLGTLDLSGSSLTVGGDLTVSGLLRVDSSSELLGPVVITSSSSLTALSTIEAASLIQIDSQGSSTTLKPGTLRFDEGSNTPIILETGLSGGTVTLSGGATTRAVAISADGGVEIVTVADNSRFRATSRSVALGRPSLNDALVCTIDDPIDVFYCDLDDDGLRDVRTQYTPVKELVLDDGTGFRCDGPTSLTSCDVSDAATFRSTWSCDVDDDGTIDFYCDDLAPGPRLVVSSGAHLRCDGTANYADLVVDGTITVAGTCELDGPTVSRDYFEFDPNDDGLADAVCESTPIGQTFRVLSGTEMRCQGPTVCESTLEAQGTMNCRSDWSCDANDDGTIDVQCSALTGPELLVASGTRFACDGLATFAQPTAVNSDLTVTGSLTVFGPKAFAQQHPEEPTKEIIYVALEGNEAGTYTRGSAQLKNGVAEIQLPEDFHLVTNEEGLTAQITPRGPVNSMLYVESVTPTTLVVKASNKKDANVKFDFTVNGVRSGFENHQVIRDKKSLAINE